MANGSIPPGYNDRNRDGMDDDIDRKYGNDSDSRQYARKYDPFRAQEFSNQPEAQNILQGQMYEQLRAESRERAKRAMQAAQKDVHYFVDVGKFIIPPENTWAAHAELVENNDMRLQFNPDQYFFDKIIDDKLHIKALNDRKHPDFDKYKGLRTNLEVLRNDIIGQYLDDGGFDRGDEVYVPLIRGIAEELAQALADDVWWKRPFMNHLDLDVANVEAVGAAEMYKYLLRRQDKQTFVARLIDGVREMLGFPTKNWGLLSLEHSPFSPEGLAAPAPDTGSAADMPMQDFLPEIAQSRAVESLALIDAANKQTSPLEQVSDADKALSVEDGRTILRWLRNMQGVDMDVQDFLSAGTVEEQCAKAEALSRLVRLYSAQMHAHPEMHSQPGVMEGSDAAGGAAMMIAEHALALQPEDSPSKALLASAIDTMPQNHFERSHQSVSQLLDHMEIGLSKMTGRQIGERTAMDRLIDASNRLQQNAIQLRAVDTLAEPKREESVELGREILRKLRGLLMGDKPIEEMIDAGKPEEKAQLAEKLAEIVEIYRNLLADALVANPGLAADARIKAANDAIGGMTHGIKLMAAKEIPSNQAAAQQIAADITQQPEEWKKLDGHQVDRLLDTMEGGLAAAVDSLEQQQQDEQREEDMAQEIIEASLLHSEGARKRRRRRSQRSGLGGKKQEKLRRDITADDRAAGQGRFAEEREMKKEIKQSAYMGLSDTDIASIRALGNTLRGANSEANSLPSIATATAAPPVTADLNGDGKITADEMSAAAKITAERAAEQSRQSRRGNRNNRPTK